MLDVRKLKSEMAASGITQKKLAELLGISENTLSKCLTGKRSFDTDEASAICELLGITDNNRKAEIFLA